MKHCIKVFVFVLLSCALLVAVAYGISVASNRLSAILSSKEASVNKTKDEKKITVILDAGHGGVDGGAVGPSGILEKDLNLDLTMKLEGLLREQNIDVVVTRSTDEMLTYEGASSQKNGDLRARLKIAEDVENGIFVSIHMNKFSQSSVKGVTVYYSPNHIDGKKLAETVMASVVEKLQPENKRPIKEAGSSIYILNRISMPAILIECGFLSNEYEASLLASDEYRMRLAEVIRDSIINYLAEAKMDES